MNDELKAKLLALGEEIFEAGKLAGLDVQAQVDAAVAAALAAFKAQLSASLSGVLAAEAADLESKLLAAIQA